MYRTVKPFYGSGTMLVLFPLIVYVVTTTSLSNVEGAQTSPSQWEIQEAQTIVGRFLRNEAGTTWLADLARTASAPLTTTELMNAILQATKQGGKVWHAATILAEALKTQSINGTRPDFMLEQNENWKDLIASIEMEDDIICLYRKNANETTKKADDWEKFLKNVSPGYTVHLAIDTGVKYVICLKKINVPETIIEERLTTRMIPSVLPVFSTEVQRETTSKLPVKENVSTIFKSEQIKNALKSNTRGKESDSGEKCEDNKPDGTKDVRDGDDDHEIESEYIDEDDVNDDEYNFDYDDPMDNKWSFKKMRRGMEDDSSVESEHPPKFGWNKPIGQRDNSLRVRDQPRSYNSARTLENYESRISRDVECKRPIIFVVPNENGPSAHQPLPQRVGLPIQRNIGSNLPQISKTPYPSSGISGVPYNYFRLPNNSPRSMMPQKGGYQPFVSQNTHFQPRLPVRKSDEPFGRSIVEPIQTRKAISSQLLNRNSDRTMNSQRRPVYIGNSGYPSRNSLPLRTETLSGPRIRDNPSLPIRGTSEFDRSTLPTRSIAIPGSRIPDRSNQIGYDSSLRFVQVRNNYRDGQTIGNSAGVRSPPREPIFRPQTPKNFQQSKVQSLGSSIDDRSWLGQFPIANQASPVRQNFNGINPQFIDIERSRQRAGQCTNYHPTLYYPAVNNLVRQPNDVNPATLSILNALCANPLNRFLPLCAANSPGNLLVRSNNPTSSITSSSPCNRPIKLYIAINGKVQEPLDVAVLSLSGQKIEIVGSANPTIPYGSRSLRGEIPATDELYDNEESIEPRDDTRRSERKEEIEEAFSMRNTSVKSDDLEEETKSTIAPETEATSVRSNIAVTESLKIEERFFRNVTTVSNNIMETNETMITTTTNSTSL